jgi:gas vesicle protein
MREEYEFDDEPFVVIEKESGGVGSFLLGIAIGAGIALLFAPQAGADTRQGLKRSAQRVRRAAEDVVDDVRETVTDSLQQARQQVEDKIESARQTVETKKQQVADAMEAGRAAAQQARDDLERRIAETKAAYHAGAEVAHRGRKPRSRATADDEAPDL